jgi:hypothetical protein
MGDVRDEVRGEKCCVGGARDDWGLEVMTCAARQAADRHCY